jgi:hypothetical protein
MTFVRMHVKHVLLTMATATLSSDSTTPRQRLFGDGDGGASSLMLDDSFGGLTWLLSIRARMEGDHRSAGKGVRLA